jgi:hypothetical protein
MLLATDVQTWASRDVVRRPLKCPQYAARGENANCLAYYILLLVCSFAHHSSCVESVTTMPSRLPRR